MVGGLNRRVVNYDGQKKDFEKDHLMKNEVLTKVERKKHLKKKRIMLLIKNQNFKGVRLSGNIIQDKVEIS